ncbi:MAG TPA: response regulator [Chromatiales bacterium]|nr:response regulator [Chromatiales bacterium]
MLDVSMITQNKLNKSPRLILLIEDNDDDILLTKMAINDIAAPPDLLVIKDGKAGLDYLLDDSAREPSLTLLDLKLPAINGLAVAEKISENERLRRIPLVALTTSLEPGDISRCYDANINSYLRKPVDFDEFRSLIKKTIEYWLELNIPATGR